MEPKSEWLSEAKVRSFVEPLASSPKPIWGLSALFFGTIPLSPSVHPFLPPFYQRFGFGLIFAGAGYILSQGDRRNGSGTATAWSLTYLLLNLPKSIRSRSVLSLTLSGCTAAAAGIYGSDYFYFGPLSDTETEQ